MPTARQVNWAKFRVFAVSVPAFAILGLTFYLLTGGTLLEEKSTLYLYIPDATGLGSDAPVRVDGIDVGKVRSVALSGQTKPDRIVRVAMTVEREWLSKIPNDSWAQLSSDSLIGDKFVDVSSGASRTPIAPNGEIIYRENPDITKRLDVRQFRKQIDQVNAILTDLEEGRGPLGEFVQGTGMYEEWRKLLRESQVAIDAISAPKGTLGTYVHTDTAYQKIRKPFQDLDQSLATLQSGQGQLGALLRDDAQYQQITANIVDLRRSLAEIASGPLFQSDADYKKWSQQISGLTQAVDSFNRSPAMTSSDTYENLKGMMRELQVNLKDFRVDPKKYLRYKIF